MSTNSTSKNVSVGHVTIGKPGYKNMRRVSGYNIPADVKKELNAISPADKYGAWEIPADSVPQSFESYRVNGDYDYEFTREFYAEPAAIAFEKKGDAYVSGNYRVQATQEERGSGKESIFHVTIEDEEFNRITLNGYIRFMHYRGYWGALSSSIRRGGSQDAPEGAKLKFRVRAAEVLAAFLNQVDDPEKIAARAAIESELETLRYKIERAKRELAEFERKQNELNAKLSAL